MAQKSRNASAANTLSVEDKIRTYLKAAEWTMMSDNKYKLLMKPDMSYNGEDKYLRFTESQGIALSMATFAPTANHLSGIVNQEARISGMKKIWATVSNNEHSEILMDENSLIRSVVDKGKEMGEQMGWLLSKYLLNGPWFAVAQGDGLATGKILVSNIAKFARGMALEFEVSGGANITGFVGDLDVDASGSGYADDVELGTGELTIVSALTGTDVVDLSSIDADAKVYIYNGGVSTRYPLDLRSTVFGAGVDGGSDTIYGVNKSTSRFFQSVSRDGSTMNTAEKLFEGIENLATEMSAKHNRCMPDMVLLPCKKYNELRKSFDKQEDRIVRRQVKAPSYTVFPFQNMTVNFADGMVDLVKCKELEEDVVFLADTKGSMIKKAYTSKMGVGTLLSSGSLLKHGPTNNGDRWTTRNSTSSQYEHLQDRYLMMNSIFDCTRVGGIYDLPKNLS